MHKQETTLTLNERGTSREDDAADVAAAAGDGFLSHLPWTGPLLLPLASSLRFLSLSRSSPSPSSFLLSSPAVWCVFAKVCTGYVLYVCCVACARGVESARDDAWKAEFPEHDVD